MTGYATVAEAARMTGRNRNTIYPQIARGNVADAVVDGRYMVRVADVAALPRRQKITPEQAAEIQRRGNAGELHSALSKEYGISRPHVTRIVNGGRWQGDA